MLMVTNYHAQAKPLASLFNLFLVKSLLMMVILFLLLLGLTVSFLFLLLPLLLLSSLFFLILKASSTSLQVKKGITIKGTDSRNKPVITCAVGFRYAFNFSSMFNYYYSLIILHLFDYSF